jgi:hypothetical protein
MSGQTEKAQPGYAEIKAASALHPDSGAWAFFMREIIRLPREMTPAISQVIRLEMWKLAPNPLEAVRSAANRGTWPRMGQADYRIVNEGFSIRQARGLLSGRIFTHITFDVWAEPTI